MKAPRLLSSIILLSFLAIGCQDKTENDAKINIIRETLSNIFLRDRWILQQIKKAQSESPNPTQYDPFVDSVQTIFKESEKVFGMADDEIGIVSSDSVKNYERFLNGYIKKHKLEKLVAKNLEMAITNDTTNVNFWIYMLKVVEEEHLILVDFADKVGIHSIHCNFSRFNIFTDDIISLEKPYYITVDYYLENTKYARDDCYKIDKIQILLNNKTLVKGFEVTRHRAISILRFIPHQKGKYTINITFKEPIPSFETRSFEVELK